MIPVLFDPKTTTFTTEGLGRLTDAISCEVIEERNGEYELTMTYPVNGVHFEDIEDRCIITAIPSPYRTAQPFRIYQVDTPINGVVTIHAHHISYDLSGVPVKPFTASTCAAALAGLKSNSVVDSLFTVDTNKNVSANFSLTVPTSFRSLLGGQEGSILDVYGTGEYLFDNWSIYLYVNRGSDNGVTVEYGKNLTDFNMERNLENLVTGVYPYWTDPNTGNIVDCGVVEISNFYDYAELRDVNENLIRSTDGEVLRVGLPYARNVKIIDFSSYFESEPTEDQLYARCAQYVTDNNIGQPKVSIKASFLDVSKTEEYKDLALLEQVDLCDTVTVKFPRIGLSAKAEIVKISTNVLLDKYNSVEIGDARSTLADTIATASMTATRAETKATTTVATAVTRATDLISGATGGYFVILRSDDGTPSGMAIMDTPDQATATNVWRWTSGGLGHSSTGFAGPYDDVALTMDGQVLANTLYVVRDGVEVLAADESDSGFPRLIMRDSEGDDVFKLYSYKVNNSLENSETGACMGIYDGAGVRIGYLGTIGDSSSGQLTGTAFRIYDRYTGKMAINLMSQRVSNQFYSGGRNRFALYDAQTGNTAAVLYSYYYDNNYAYPFVNFELYDLKNLQTRIAIQSYQYDSGGVMAGAFRMLNHDTNLDRTIDMFDIYSIGSDTPYIKVYDSDNSTERTLTLRAITISGTTYYLYAAT